MVVRTSARRWHLFRPRRIVPGQIIHPSVWCGDVYRPHATLGDGIEILTILDGASDPTIRNQPSGAGLSEEDRMMELAWIRRYAAHELDVLLKLSQSCHRYASSPRLMQFM